MKDIKKWNEQKELYKNKNDNIADVKGNRHLVVKWLVTSAINLKVWESRKKFKPMPSLFTNIKYFVSYKCIESYGNKTDSM